MGAVRQRIVVVEHGLCQVILVQGHAHRVARALAQRAGLLQGANAVRRAPELGLNVGQVVQRARLFALQAEVAPDGQLLLQYLLCIQQRALVGAHNADAAQRLAQAGTQPVLLCHPPRLLQRGEGLGIASLADGSVSPDHQRADDAGRGSAGARQAQGLFETSCRPGALPQALLCLGEHEQGVHLGGPVLAPLDGGQHLLGELARPRGLAPLHR